MRTTRGANGQRKLFLARMAIAVLAPLLLASSASAQAKKLLVVTEQAVVHLDPDERSPVVATLSRDSALTLASPVKSRTSWFYVYFTDKASGKKRSGYILESSVAKQFSEIRSVSISSGGESRSPAASDIGEILHPFIEWGADEQAVVDAEGLPGERETSDGIAILRYKKKIAERNCVVEYVFDSGRLAKTRCVFSEIPEDAVGSMGDFQKLRDRLIAAFGPPREIQTPGPEAEPSPVAADSEETARASWDVPGAELSLISADPRNGIGMSAEFIASKSKATSS